MLNYREVKERYSDDSERADNLDSVKNGPKKQEMECLAHTDETYGNETYGTYNDRSSPDQSMTSLRSFETG